MSSCQGAAILFSCALDLLPLPFQEMARSPLPVSSSLELFPALSFVGKDVERMKGLGTEERGAVFTRREVVDFILDLVGYTPDRPLWRSRVLEPSFGSGDFLLPALNRLLESASRDGIKPLQLRGAIRAVELHSESYEATRKKVVRTLVDGGLLSSDAIELADLWLINSDFLIEDFSGDFDFVIGNPPYVRQELIPASLLAEYRRRFSTLYDRADLYVPFIERSLRLLNAGGTLGFICSDRWMKNRYGGPLREMVSKGYRLRYYVDMVGTPAFQTDVIAYPAITVIQKAEPGPVRVAHRPEITAKSLADLSVELKKTSRKQTTTVSEVELGPSGSEPWLLEADARPSLGLVRRLEREFPPLETAGCSVGIGVATGADKVFIGPFDEMDVEPDRKLPLVMTRDILDGTVGWRGLGVINPFEEDGRLAELDQYPRFAAYLEKHGETLRKRHCAQRSNAGWYRTIDRITPSLAKSPKLLIPDIKGSAHIVFEEGRLYPHHNLYYIISKEWPLNALQVVLRTGIAHLFVRAYSTKMHGGALRFQAQYLRRIRLPFWGDLTPEDRTDLIEAGKTGSTEMALSIMKRIYRLSPTEASFLNHHV